MVKKISGIYIIRNIVNGKCYIGSSVNIRRRWQVHMDTARRGKHHSAHFQRAWNKYGQHSFKFDIFEEMPPIKEQLEYNEQSYLTLYMPLYNSRLTVRCQNISDTVRESLSERMFKINKSRIGIKQTSKSIKLRTLSRMGLSESQIKEIAWLYVNGQLQGDLAKKFNVSKSAIWRIVNNKIKCFPNIVESWLPGG